MIVNLCVDGTGTTTKYISSKVVRTAFIDIYIYSSLQTAAEYAAQRAEDYQSINAFLNPKSSP